MPINNTLKTPLNNTCNTFSNAANVAQLQTQHTFSVRRRSYDVRVVKLSPAGSLSSFSQMLYIHNRYIIIDLPYMYWWWQIHSRSYDVTTVKLSPSGSLSSFSLLSYIHNRCIITDSWWMYWWWQIHSRSHDVTTVNPESLMIESSFDPHWHVCVVVVCVLVGSDAAQPLHRLW